MVVNYAPFQSLSEFCGIFVLSNAQGIKCRCVYISFEVLLYAAKRIVFCLCTYCLLIFMVTEPPMFSTLALPSVVTWHIYSVAQKIHCHVLYRRNVNG